VPVSPLYRFLVDDRFPESMSAARIAAQQETSVYLMSGGDLVLVQRAQLHWSRTPAAIAGVTGHGSLFVLEQLARDHGMRVISREELPREPNSAYAKPVFSWVIGPGNGLSKESPRR